MKTLLNRVTFPSVKENIKLLRVNILIYTLIYNNPLFKILKAKEGT